MPLSTFLNGSVPTQLRGLQMLALSDVGQLGAGTITDDGGGGGTTTWAYSGTIPCRVDPLTQANSRITGGAIDERSTHIVTIPTGSTVTTNNRFLIAARGTYEVTAIRERTDPVTQVFEVIRAS